MACERPDAAGTMTDSAITASREIGTLLVSADCESRMNSRMCRRVGKASSVRSFAGRIGKCSRSSPSSCAFLMLSIPRSASSSASSSTTSAGYPVCSQTKRIRKSARSSCSGALTASPFRRPAAGVTAARSTSLERRFRSRRRAVASKWRIGPDSAAADNGRARSFPEVACNDRVVAGSAASDPPRHSRSARTRSN